MKPNQIGPLAGPVAQLDVAGPAGAGTDCSGIRNKLRPNYRKSLTGLKNVSDHGIVGGNEGDVARANPAQWQRAMQ